MLLYSMLHLTGYAVSLDDLKSFRQWGSITPGHPEYGLTPGVEATTGPLGQGLVNGVGMAIAERRLAGEFNRPGHEIIDHRTYVICSDGDLQEGITAEAALARRPPEARQADRPLRRQPDPARRADRLDLHRGRRSRASTPTAGTPSGSTTATTSPRSTPPSRPRKADDRPSLIAVRTHIGFGSPNKQDTQKAHGAPLGPDEVRLTKEAYGWDPDKTFFVPDEAGELFLPRRRRRARPRVAAWDAGARRLRRRPTRPRPPSCAAASPAACADGWDAGLNVYETGSEVATRNASQDLIQSLAGPVPELFGGSADLSESNLTDVKARATTTSRPPTPGATSGSASASTRWAASPTASPTTAGSSPTARRS